MTLRELVLKTSYKAAFNYIYRNNYKHLPDDEVAKYALKYNQVYDLLKNLKFDGNTNYKIYITEKEEVSLEDEDPIKFTDVCLYDEEIDQIFSIDLINWSELIDLEILDCLNLDNYSLLGSILWELTFYGFDLESIEEEKQKLKNAISEIDKTKPMTLDEFKKSLSNI